MFSSRGYATEVMRLTKLRELFKCLIIELKKTQLPSAFPENLGGKFIMSGWVSAGDGGSLMLSREMEKLITDIAKVLKQNGPGLALTHTDQEWRGLVRTTLGPPLASIDLSDDDDSNAELVHGALREQLFSERTPSDREHMFGCTLFANDFPSFSIGPVIFETRVDWLERKKDEGFIDNRTAQRIRLRWQGEKPRKRKSVVDTMFEDDVVATIGKCRYVCSVKTEGFAPQASYQKAQVAARLALTALALTWELPSGALSGFRLLIDGEVRIQHNLVFRKGLRSFAGRTMKGRPNGPPISEAEWIHVLEGRRDEFAVVAETIAFYLDASGNAPRPKLMNVFAQSLLWFHEACQEEINMLAIVKFAASLDALAIGGESSGISRLINARLGMSLDQKLFSNGQTVREAVKEIYSSGRSRMIHGTNDKFGYDWQSTRHNAEILSRLCLTRCLDHASRIRSDDPNSLSTTRS